MKIYCDALKDMWRGPDVKGLIVWRVLLTLNLCRLLLCKYLFVSEDGNIITNNEEKEKKNIRQDPRSGDSLRGIFSEKTFATRLL